MIKQTEYLRRINYKVKYKLYYIIEISDLKMANKIREKYFIDFIDHEQGLYVFYMVNDLIHNLLNTKTIGVII